MDTKGHLLSDDTIRECKIKIQKKVDRLNDSQGAKLAEQKSVNTAQQQLSLNQRNGGLDSTASQEGLALMMQCGLTAQRI